MGFIESFWGTQRGGNVCSLSKFSAQGAEQKGDLSHSYCGISQAPKAPTSDWFSGLAAVCRMEHRISASPKGSVYSEQQALLLVPFLAKKKPPDCREIDSDDWVRCQIPVVFRSSLF